MTIFSVFLPPFPFLIGQKFPIASQVSFTFTFSFSFHFIFSFCLLILINNAKKKIHLKEPRGAHCRFSKTHQSSSRCLPFSIAVSIVICRGSCSVHVCTVRYGSWLKVSWRRLRVPLGPAKRIQLSVRKGLFYLGDCNLKSSNIDRFLYSRVKKRLR